MVPADTAQPLNIIAHENVLNRMTTPVTGRETPPAQVGLPIDEYFPSREGPASSTAKPSCSITSRKRTPMATASCLFRRSDVISAGDIFTPERYPFIDMARGGSVQGKIAALNRIIEIAIPEDKQEGGTYIIPGHGRLCDEADVVEYRDMVTIVRDRVQDVHQERPARSSRSRPRSRRSTTIRSYGPRRATSSSRPSTRA